ncbi:cell surface protein [Chlamydia buteonis]|uniref:Cell surface protein n=1 Tax=Chlamydia buteonis TaxID=2494525 RepID=A0ABX8LEQ9_9CHLA|nr:cell surface protein [Chlamydia buteonis]QXE26638.1 cell surface protein [Chlamydia buteonis]QXE27567.1 cell surface protein [Chlamydia buteonis]
MVNPVGPIDESKNIAPADLSTLGMQASAANRSSEAESISGADGKNIPSQPSVSTLGRLSFLSSAKNALVNFFNKISALFTGKSVPQSFEEAKTQATNAQNALKAATTYDQFKTALQQLQDAVKYMDQLASTDEQRTEVATLKTALAEQQTVIDTINKLGGILEENQKLLDAIKTTSSIDQVTGAAGQVEVNKAAAAALIEELKKLGVTGDNYPVISDTEAKINTSSTEITKLAEAIMGAYSAGKNSTAAVGQAQANNSPANIEACKQKIAEAQAAIDAALALAPNSPIVKAAQKEQQKAAADIEKVKPSGGSDVPIGGPGAPSSVGTSQNRGVTLGEVRISMLLADVDNETAAIIMKGFRNMIDNFHAQHPDFTAPLEEVLAQVTDLTTQVNPADAEATTQLQEIQQALQEALQGISGQDGLTNALGAITTAASISTGTPIASANQGGSAVKQLYKTGSASASSKSYADSLSAGYGAYQSLNDVYSRSGAANREVLNRTATPALTQTVSRTETQPRGNDTAAQRFARTIAGNSHTLGDVYASVSALQTALGVLQSNPQANEEEIKQKLTSAITKAPQSGYPYVQLSNDATQKFIAKLEDEFTRGSKRLAEAKEAAFEKQSLFIQQVLVNIASLFSGYLQ